MITFRFPSYCRPNIWPNDDLPELQTGITMAGCIRYSRVYLFKVLKKLSILIFHMLSVIIFN